jgi:fructose-1,6-bisphosphatase I/sedoheptulose-1,7-bisphosphatase
MPLSKRWTLTRFLIEQGRRFAGASRELGVPILDIALASKAIARIAAIGDRQDSFGRITLLRAAETHVQGEMQEAVSLLRNDGPMPVFGSRGFRHSRSTQAPT